MKTIIFSISLLCFVILSSKLSAQVPCANNASSCNLTFNLSDNCGGPYTFSLTPGTVNCATTGSGCGFLTGTCTVSDGVNPPITVGPNYPPTSFWLCGKFLTITSDCCSVTVF